MLAECSHNFVWPGTKRYISKGPPNIYFVFFSEKTMFCYSTVYLIDNVPAKGKQK